MDVLVGAMTPSWFHGVDAALELFSVIIALVIAFIGYRCYKVSGFRRYLAFSGAFFLLAASYGARMITELLVYLERLVEVKTALEAGSATPAFLWGRFIYIGVVFLAYLAIAAVALKIEEPKVLSLIGALLLLLALQAYKEPSTILFHVINLILLAFIILHFARNYLEKGTQASFVTLLAFIFILGETLLFLGTNYIPLLYIGAYLFRFIGHLLLLSGMIRVIRA